MLEAEIPRLLAAVPAVMGSDNLDTEVPRVRDGVRNLGAHGNGHEHALDRMSSAVLALRRAQIEVGTLRGGMVSGKGSVAPCFELPDGRVVLAGNSVGAFHDRGPRDQGLAGRPPRARSAVSELVIRVFGNRARAVAGQRTGTTAEGVNERVERIYAAVGSLMSDLIICKPMTFVCDGCGVRTELDLQQFIVLPDLPEQWITTPQGEFCPACQRVGK